MISLVPRPADEPGGEPEADLEAAYADAMEALSSAARRLEGLGGAEASPLLARAMIVITEATQAAEELHASFTGRDLAVRRIYEDGYAAGAASRRLRLVP